MSGYAEISSLLIDLEAVMRNSGLWASEPPAPEALASSQPFCVDTLALEEWLQFVFIPRIRAIVEAETTMPAKCEIKPVLEQAMSNPSAALVSVIGRLDEAITRAE
ncbi:YqcC family protein [Litorivivens sp.]|uniref:YqcC family protein n=1 Tax=Litorivivens sp. TaxID=2020868 RepID=UPI0035645246